MAIFFDALGASLDEDNAVLIGIFDNTERFLAAAVEWNLQNNFVLTRHEQLNIVVFLQPVQKGNLCCIAHWFVFSTSVVDVDMRRGVIQNVVEQVVAPGAGLQVIGLTENATSWVDFLDFHILSGQGASLADQKIVNFACLFGAVHLVNEDFFFTVEKNCGRCNCQTCSQWQTFRNNHEQENNCNSQILHKLFEEDLPGEFIPKWSLNDQNDNGSCQNNNCSNQANATESGQDIVQLWIEFLWA